MIETAEEVVDVPTNKWSNVPKVQTIDKGVEVPEVRVSAGATRSGNLPSAPGR